MSVYLKDKDLKTLRLRENHSRRYYIKTFSESYILSDNSNEAIFAEVAGAFFAPLHCEQCPS